ncbi:hypothetical protein [Vibrio rotiferianus]|uniref:hypothetical protein n=1 Tax=Vibrio rotiferianus TaxID=190895 RepID=UPI0005EF8B98|nr:hypothetical protein [Vibrio rotiferianus]
MSEQIKPKYSKLTEGDVAELQARFSSNSREEIIEYLIGSIDEQCVLASKINNWDESSHGPIGFYLNVDLKPDSRNIADKLDVLINVARKAEMIVDVDAKAMHWLAYKYPLALAQMTIARRKHQTIHDEGMYIFSNYFTNRLLNLKRDPSVREEYEMWGRYIENYDYKKQQPQQYESSFSLIDTQE